MQEQEFNLQRRILTTQSGSRYEFEVDEDDPSVIHNLVRHPDGVKPIVYGDAVFRIAPELGKEALIAVAEIPEGQKHQPVLSTSAVETYAIPLIP